MEIVEPVEGSKKRPPTSLGSDAPIPALKKKKLLDIGPFLIIKIAFIPVRRRKACCTPN